MQKSSRPGVSGPITCPTACPKFAGASGGGGFHEVQVGRVELGDLRQGDPILDGETAPAQRDQTAPPKILQHAIDVDVREAQRVADLDLRDRQVAPEVLREADGVEL